MIESIRLADFSWWSAGLLVAAFLLIVLIEFRRTPAVFLMWRVILTFFMISGIAAIIWRPSVLQPRTTNQVIVVGEETNRSRLDTLRDAYPDARLISQDSLYMPLDGTNVLVTGQGLAEYNLRKVHNSHLELALDPTPPGIVEFYPPGKPVLGDTLTWEGYFQTPDSIQLELWWQDKRIDSVRLDSSGWFVLRHLPKVAGPQVYRLTARSANILQYYRIPADIRDSRKLRAGLFVTYPSFELRAIKEYMAESGLEVMVRQSVSRDRYTIEYLNLPEEPVVFSSGFLSSLDLLVADQVFLENLTRDELDVLERRIRQGLGLIIISVESKAGRGRISLPVRDAGNNELFLVEDPGVISVSKSGGYIKSGGKQLGRGRIMVSLVPQTYTWILEGNKSEYEGYWSSLIRETSRKSPPVIDLLAEPVWQNIRQDFVVISEGQPEVYWDEVPLPPARDIYLPHRWHVTVWERDTGWHVLTSNRDTVNVYVHDTSEWKPLRFARQKKELVRISSGEKMGEEAGMEFSPIPAWYFYLLVLACLGMLWALPKFL